MKLRHLRYVVELGRTLHFTQAAERLGVAQPALSHAISALEKELGVVLFERTSRRIKVTPAGTFFIERAETILAEVDRLSMTMQEHAELLRGTISIATVIFFGETVLPGIVRDFCRIYPGITVDVQAETFQRSLDGLRDGTFDVAFLNMSGERAPSDLSFTTIERDEMALATPVGHRLAGRARVRFAEVRDEMFVGYQPGAALHDTLAGMARAADFNPRIVARSRSIIIIRSLVAAGLGIAIGARQYFESPGPPIVTVPLTPPEPIVVNMVTPPAGETNPAARAFLAFVRARFVANAIDKQAL